MTTPHTVIVTGGSAGIGADLCRHYVALGYTVISMARKAPDWSHKRLVPVLVDLLDSQATQAAIDDITAKYDVSHFVHNAGVIWPNLLENVSLEELQGLTQIHLGSAIQIMQAILPSMRAKKFGRVVLMSSRGALGLQTRTAYAATKAGMLGMARTWALEFADQGITVNVVAPGPIQTPMFYDVVPAGSEREQNIAAGIPVKRLGRVDDITRAVQFFSDPENSFVTGQTLYVCGGASIGTLTI
ncbi:SDR family oxidoreductase [Paenalcaligenes suwonensis]|uniref:SDR family oxidoreductase n=1 Tax=Paenalcaligenes suwonensis TaxID=1202713 RepID=UPI001408799B|nr:SDR family oxidoreductase [Paenalcaligenes suwonensis]NHC62510.1 SDR family oxidoreductase [Paenalcaligenes suwonensis]